MFKNQRQGNPFYILHKGEKPFCEVGQVISVSPVRAKTANFGMYPQPTDMVVDIKAKVGEDNVSFSAVASDLLITDYPTQNGEKLVLSCDLNSINNEVNSMMQQSKQILESIEYNKSVIEGCNSILLLLNPQFAKEQERDQELTSVKEEVKELKETNARLLQMMEKFFGDKKATEASVASEVKQPLVSTSKKQ